MTPARFVQCLDALHWSTQTLADILNCDESLVEAWALGLRTVPAKTARWLNTLAVAHENAERDRPRPLKGKRYTPPEAVSALEYVPVHAYYLLRQMGLGAIAIKSLYGTENRGIVAYLVSRGLAKRDGQSLVLTEAGREIGEIEDDQ
ncbi:MAG TPA: hypothetical protein VL133_13415 [Devosia sp.]|nr:hypothetical protein [Devosia sp.]